MALGAAYFRSAQFAAAERGCKTAIASNPESGETHNSLAVLYPTTGRFAEAEKDFESIVECDCHFDTEDCRNDTTFRLRRCHQPCNFSLATAAWRMQRAIHITPRSGHSS